jgi:ATP-dependent DNA helicase DinG
VIIDKLPFEAPGDPVMSTHRSREAGRRRPVRQFQIPQAATLKRGVGRLIRDVTDRWLVIGDRFIAYRLYGRRSS